jgi:hypothetical protein
MNNASLKAVGDSVSAKSFTKRTSASSATFTRVEEDVIAAMFVD